MTNVSPSVGREHNRMQVCGPPRGDNDRRFETDWPCSRKSGDPGTAGYREIRGRRRSWLHADPLFGPPVRDKCPCRLIADSRANRIWQSASLMRDIPGMFVLQLRPRPAIVTMAVAFQPDVLMALGPGDEFLLARVQLEQILDTVFNFFFAGDRCRQ